MAQPLQQAVGQDPAVQAEVGVQIGGFTYYDLGTVLGDLSDIDYPENGPYAERVIMVAPALGGEALKGLQEKLEIDNTRSEEDRVEIYAVPIGDKSGRTATVLAMSSENLSFSEQQPSSVLAADLADRALRVREYLTALAAEPSNLLETAARYYQLTAE